MLFVKQTQRNQTDMNNSKLNQTYSTKLKTGFMKLISI